MYSRCLSDVLSLENTSFATEFFGLTNPQYKGEVLWIKKQVSKTLLEAILIYIAYMAAILLVVVLF